MVKLRSGMLILLLIAAISFVAGSWVATRGGANKPAGERKVLYYVDPMNPAFRSDKPGIAPCGMPLEAVYADRDGADGGRPGAMPLGTMRITPEKQQLIGVRTMTVEKAPWTHTLRVLGRVTPDEARVYRINAAANGWIRDVLPATTGSLVKKDELLATFSFFTTEFRTALQAYLNSVPAINPTFSDNQAPEPRASKSIQRAKEQRSREYENIRLTGRGTQGSQSDYFKQNILNYGIAETQLEEMARTGRIPEAFDIRSPAAGFVLYRNVNPGLRFDRSAEFYRIADLSKVWILADIFENEASWFKPGMRVKMELPYRKMTIYAQVSPVLPLFDAATRTLKVRLVADNPGYVMRPDMLVNVELPLNGPPAIIVPANAVLDSGLKKTVFVDRGNGYFEPRPVETGRTLGDRVEIVQGLMPGEKIVIAGNFLIDSEARMQQAAVVTTGKTSIDPVCRMKVDEDSARAGGQLREYRGKTYFFCAPGCRTEFDKDPERYLKSSSSPGKMPMPETQGAAPMPMTHDHGAMMMPETQGVAPLLPATKTGKSGRGARGVNAGSQPMPMPGNMPASPGMDFKPAPAQPMPGTAMQPAPGTQGPPPMFGPGGLGFPGTGGPGGPGFATGAKTGNPFPPANGAPMPIPAGPASGMPVTTTSDPGLRGPGGAPGGMIAPGSPSPVP